MTTAAPLSISPKDARAWLASGEAMLIDVREPDEFRFEHIAYAASLPLSRFGELFGALDLPAGRKLVFQCQKGKRGEQACVAAATLPGTPAAYNIEGGIEAWKAAGLPVVPGAGQGPSLFRQVQMIVGSLVLLFVVLGFAGYAWAFAVAGLFGAALAIAGLTGFCGLALVLARMPWNKP